MDPSDNWIPIIAIALSLSIPIVAIVVEYLSKRNKMRIFEKAIEKGISLEGLSLDEKKAPRVPYRGGMVVLASGIGICIFAVLIGQMENDALMPLLGLGSIPTLIGIALIINDRMNYDKLFNKEPDSQ